MALKDFNNQSDFEIYGHLFRKISWTYVYTKSAENTLYFYRKFTIGIPGDKTKRQF